MNASHSHPGLGSCSSLDDRADRIIAAALVTFSENGYTNTTLGDIAARAGISTSALLRDFPSKEEIFRDVIRSTLIGSLSARNEAAVSAQEPSATEAVRAFARRYWTTMEQPELASVVRLIVAELPRFPELAVFHGRARRLEPLG